MSSVQELILAAQAKQRPSILSQLAQVGQSGIEGYQEGVKTGDVESQTRQRIAESYLAQQKAAQEQQALAAQQAGQAQILADQQKEQAAAQAAAIAQQQKAQAAQTDGTVKQAFTTAINPDGATPDSTAVAKLTREFKINDKGLREETMRYEPPKDQTPDLTFTPDQFDAMKSGDSAKIRAAFPSGIPKEAVGYMDSMNKTNIDASNKATNTDTAALKDVQDKYIGDKNVQTAQGTLDKLGQAKGFLAAGTTNNTVAKQALQTALAFVSTGGQRVNEQEMNQFLGGQTMTNKANQWYQQIDNGTLTPRDAQDMQGVIDIYQKAAKQNLQDAGFRYAKQLSQRTGNRPEQEYQRLTGDQYQTVTAPTAAPSATQPQTKVINGQTFVNQNGKWYHQ